MHELSIQLVIAYIVHLYSKKRSISTVLHVLGYVNMARISQGYGRLVSHQNYAIVKQLQRAVKAGGRATVLVLPDMSLLLQLLQKGGSEIVCISLFMFTLGCLCALRVEEMWHLSIKYVYKNSVSGTFVIKWPKHLVKAGLRRVLPAYCSDLITVFCAFSFNPLSKVQRGSFGRFIKKRLFCTLAACRHVGANICLQSWSDIVSVAETLGHKSVGTSYMYLDAWASNVKPEVLTAAAVDMMRQKFPQLSSTF